VPSAPVSPTLFADFLNDAGYSAPIRAPRERDIMAACGQLKSATAASRKNQADIAAAFLELAREERKLGNRSLIDVLTGETELINAQSDAESAESDVIIAAYKLLNIVGELTPGVFRGQPTLMPPKPGQTEKAPAPMREAKAEDAPPAAEADPLAPYRPDPEMVPDGELTGAAIQPFADFFEGVRDVFEDNFEKSGPAGLKR